MAAIQYESEVRVGCWVRDRAGEYGRGRVTKTYSIGCDVAWERGDEHFLGLGWLEKITSPEVQASAREELTFEIADSGEVLYNG